MAFVDSYALTWQYLPGNSILLQSAMFDSTTLCSSNEGAFACSFPGQFPGRAVLPQETAQLLQVHAAQAEARLELYNHGPKLMYRLIPTKPHIPYPPGYLERVASEVQELKNKIWAEKTTGVTFNQRPIHPRGANERARE